MLVVWPGAAEEYAAKNERTRRRNSSGWKPNAAAWKARGTTQSRLGPRAAAKIISEWRQGKATSGSSQMRTTGKAREATALTGETSAAGNTASAGSGDRRV